MISLDSRTLTKQLLNDNVTLCFISVLSDSCTFKSLRSSNVCEFICSPKLSYIIYITLAEQLSFSQMSILFRKAKWPRKREKWWSCQVILPKLNTEKWSYIWPKCCIILAPTWEVQVNLSLIGGVKGYLFEMLISKAYVSSKSLDL